VDPVDPQHWFKRSYAGCRKDAESLLRYDGDFLVRESQGSAGQYVLTGMQGSTRPVNNTAIGVGPYWAGLGWVALCGLGWAGLGWAGFSWVRDFG
jgi:hypothetical protein